MVERKSELKRRYHRKQKLRKLKSRLATAKDHQKRDVILHKIHLLSPWWRKPRRLPGDYHQALVPHGRQRRRSALPNHTSCINVSLFGAGVRPVSVPVAENFLLILCQPLQTAHINTADASVPGCAVWIMRTL